jgi:carbon-monoxide dehydrogenase medium subunit
VSAGIDRPASLDEAFERMAATGARPIAGGVAIMLGRALGRGRDGRWVSIGKLPELRRIDVDAATGELVVGAAATLAELAASAVTRQRAPLLAHAAGVAASEGVRSIATIGGNLLDSAATSDLAAAAIALDASLVIGAMAGERLINGDALTTASRPVGSSELLLALRVSPPSNSGWSLQRLQTQGRGDRPAVTVALRLVAVDGRATAVRVAATFLADRPIELTEVAGVVEGIALSEIREGRIAATVEGAAHTAVDRAIGQGGILLDDTRASADYRHEVVGVLAARGVVEAAGRITT